MQCSRAWRAFVHYHWNLQRLGGPEGHAQGEKPEKRPHVGGSADDVDDVTIVLCDGRGQQLRWKKQGGLSGREKGLWKTLAVWVSSAIANCAAAKQRVQLSNDHFPHCHSIRKSLRRRKYCCGFMTLFGGPSTRLKDNCVLHKDKSRPR